MKQSANDLSIAIYEENKKADWAGAFTDFIGILNGVKTKSSFLQKLIEDAKTAFSTGDGIEKLYSQMDVIGAIYRILQQMESSQDGHTLVEKMDEIRKTRNLSVTITACMEIRKKFEEDRPGYIVNSLFAPSGFPTSSLFSLTGSPSAIVAELIDELLLHVSPDYLKITYETLTGKERIIHCRYKSITEIDDGEFLAAPKPRLFGAGLFDTFVVAPFYDIHSRKWEEVPISLIKKIEYDGETELGDHSFLVCNAKNNREDYKSESN